MVRNGVGFNLAFEYSIFKDVVGLVRKNGLIVGDLMD